MTSIELGHMCRGCLSTKNDDLQPIFDGTISNLFSSCTRLEVSESDGLSIFICSVCLEKCNSWYAFKEQCEQNYSIYRKFTLQQPFEIDSDEECQNTEFGPVNSLIDEYDHGNSGAEASKVDESYLFVYNEGETIAKKTRKISGKYRPEDRVDCDLCDKSFRLQEQLNTHKNTVHLGLKPVTCELCNIGFSSERNYKRHISMIHNANLVKPYTCKECDTTFAYRSSLKKHELIHENVIRFTCDICGKGFIYKSGLSSHMVSHSKDAPYACEECGGRFKSQKMLQTHIPRHHEHLKKYVCSECGKLFSTPGELKTHSRTHSGERPYPCDLCPKTFRTCSQLYVHLRKHSGARPYGCDLCDQKFTAIEVMRHHRMIHTGEKPHQCQVCFRCFRQKCALLKHMKTHKSVGEVREGSGL